MRMACMIAMFSMTVFFRVPGTSGDEGETYQPYQRERNPILHTLQKLKWCGF
jgi:hypothetical protein